jgi:hypothetical protein
MCRTLRRSFRNPDQLSTSSLLDVHHTWPAPGQAAHPVGLRELMRVAATKPSDLVELIGLDEGGEDEL